VENRLIAASLNGSMSFFVYDGDGKRVMKIENGETILYINQYYEKNLTTGNVTSSYYLGGRLVATKENEVLRYVHQDHLTCTSLMTDSSGAQIGQTMQYLPFGQTLSGAVPTDKKFTGQRLDATGLYYYNARYYDATIVRFISADTVIQSLAKPQFFNRYTYCSNNPLKYVDPSGHIDVSVEKVKITTENQAYAFLMGFSGAYTVTSTSGTSVTVMVRSDDNLGSGTGECANGITIPSVIDDVANLMRQEVLDNTLNIILPYEDTDESFLFHYSYSIQQSDPLSWGKYECDGEQYWYPDHIQWSKIESSTDQTISPGIILYAIGIIGILVNPGTVAGYIIGGSTVILGSWISDLINLFPNQLNPEYITTT